MIEPGDRLNVVVPVTKALDSLFMAIALFWRRFVLCRWAMELLLVYPFPLLFLVLLPVLVG